MSVLGGNTGRRPPLDRQVVVVTGASSGIGLATARMAARRGARVVLAARSADTLAEIRAGIEAEGGRALDVAADVGVREDVERIAERAVAAFGGIDTWVNVAGLTIYGPLAEVSDADHERLLRTNLWGTVLGSLVAVEHFRRRGGGGLINLGSVASDLPFPFQGMYVASKHAVKGFSDALRMELLQEGLPVSVTLVKPASVDTPLPQRARNYMEREPTLPPPIYAPEVVARAILHAAVHPQRDIYIGGAAKLMAATKEFAPGAFDYLAPAITAFQKRSGPPEHPEGALHAPVRAGQVRGGQGALVLNSSAYTRASLHPLALTGLAAAGLALGAATLLGPRSRRRR